MLKGSHEQAEASGVLRKEVSDSSCGVTGAFAKHIGHSGRELDASEHWRLEEVSGVRNGHCDGKPSPLNCAEEWKQRFLGVSLRFSVRDCDKLTKAHCLHDNEREAHAHVASVHDQRSQPEQ
jgi:hypothetical protein